MTQTTFAQSRTRWPVALFNRAAGAAHRVGIPRRPLTSERLLREARRKTGLSDLGEDPDASPLGVLAKSFEREARLHPLGRLAAHDLLLRITCNRLKIVETIKRHPQIAEQAVPRPLFVVGFPRTGTTLLHNLLALDPSARPLLLWESVRPTPPPRAETRRRDPRIRRMRRDLRLTYWLRPELREVHDMRADRPAECIALQQHTFVSWAFPVFADLPSYERWLWGLTEDAFVRAYRFYRRQLQLLQWRCPGGHWVLKSPAHLQVMGALLRVFPDARVIQTHRDPAKVLPSACSLFAVARSIMSDDVRPETLGPRGLEATERILERVLAFRDGFGDGRVFDVQYRDLVTDPWSTVERIYGAFGMPLPPDMRARIASWIEANPRHAHGRHRYSASLFGLREGDEPAVYRVYRERFRVPLEG